MTNMTNYTRTITQTR